MSFDLIYKYGRSGFFVDGMSTSELLSTGKGVVGVTMTTRKKYSGVDHLTFERGG